MRRFLHGEKLNKTTKENGENRKKFKKFRPKPAKNSKKTKKLIFFDTLQFESFTFFNFRFTLF